MNRLEVKYDAELDLNSRNSLKLINDRLKDDANILEFGPANGRFTKHMKNKRNCCVDIVEYNPISGQEAAQYARKSFLGEEKGDIEKYIWADELEGEKYDYILFADVLEHLYDPMTVLERCKGFLKEGGAILLSVPNIANNNIILSLLQDNFQYTTTGLLDETHIRFFTHKTVYNIANKLGLYVSYSDYVLSEIGCTEISIDFDKLYNQDLSIINEHSLGYVYQFIFELKIGSNDNYQLKKIESQSDPSIYYMKNGIYTENTRITCNETRINNSTYYAKFYVKNLIKENKFRFDPIEGNCCSCKLLDARTDIGKCEIKDSNAVIEKNGILYFSTLDPIIEFVGDFSKASYIEMEYVLKSFSVMELMKIAEKQIWEDRDKIKNDEKLLADYKDKIKNDEKLLAYYKDKIKNDEKLLEDYKDIIIKLGEEKGLLRNKLREVKNTRGYKMQESLCKIMRKFKDKNLRFIL